MGKAWLGNFPSSGRRFSEPLFLWQFEATGKNSRDCDVLIQFFPSKRKTIHFHCDALQLFVRGRSQSGKTVGGKANKATIVEFDKYCSSFGPSTDSSRLQGNRCISEYGGHNMLF